MSSVQAELEVAQRALAEAEARLVRQEEKYQSTIKEAEHTREQLEQAHQEWLAALDAIEDPIFLHDRDFRILRCNRAYQQCAGIPFKQIIGQPYYEVFPKTHAPLPDCGQALENRSDKSDEGVLVDSNIYRSRATVVRSKQGDYLYSIHTLEDVTERKRADKQLQLFRTLIDNSGDAIDVIDPVTLRFLDVNATQCRELGYSREEMLSMTVSDVDPTLTSKLNEEIQNQLRLSGSARFEAVHQRKNGSTFPVECSTKIVELDKPYALTIVRDITERKKAETDLAEQLEELHRWYNATLGREERVLELKHEVNELLGQIGQPPRYPSAEYPDLTKE
jgi:PAS domain S-box-containing protein